MMKDPTSLVAQPAMALFVAMGVADLTLGQLSRMAFMSVGAPTLAKNAKKTVGCIRNKWKKKQQDIQKCRNLATTNYSDFDDPHKECIRQQVLSRYPSSPMPPALVHQSLALLVALLPLLLALDAVIAANLSFSCTMCKCCKPRPTAQFSLLPSKK